MRSKSNPKLTLSCTQCGLYFQRFAGNVRQNPNKVFYCSNACFVASRGRKSGRVSINCPYCGVAFTRFAGEPERFCSRACSDGFKLARSIETFAERFWARFGEPTDRGCREWTGSRDQHGYGQVSDPRVGTHRTTSRVAYELAYGPIPDGQAVRHKCDNPPCGEPTHLELGTHEENMGDVAARGRHFYKRHPEAIPVGEHSGNSKLTAAAVVEIRRAYAAHEGSQLALAKQFGVSEATVQHLLSGRTWQHL